MLKMYFVNEYNKYFIITLLLFFINFNVIFEYIIFNIKYKICIKILIISVINNFLNI